MLTKKRLNLIIITIFTFLIFASTTCTASAKHKVLNKTKTKKVIISIAKKPASVKIVQSNKSIPQVKVAPKNKGVISSYQQYYDAVKNALNTYESSITFRISNYDKQIYNLNVINKVLKDVPKLNGIYLEATASITYSTPIQLIINFKYSDNKNDLTAREKQLNQKVTEIVGKVITPTMKDYEKELALHDYLISNSSYDKRLFTGNMPQESYSAYGVLINGTGVCGSYASAMNMLLNASGIESLFVIGEANDGSGSVPHAWNIVKIDGEYYHLDATWDDPVMQDGSDRLAHSYFNITDDKISKNHTWNKNEYPKCTNTTSSFDNLNVTETTPEGNIIIKINNYEEFYDSIKCAASEDKKSVSLKIMNYDSEKYDISSAVKKIYKELSIYGSYSWTYYNDEINNSEYITVNFQN